MPPGEVMQLQINSITINISHWLAMQNNDHIINSGDMPVHTQLAVYHNEGSVAHIKRSDFDFFTAVPEIRLTAS